MNYPSSALLQGIYMNNSLKLLKTPKELSIQFSKLSNRRDIAEILDVKMQTLVYYLYRTEETNNYKTFTVQKKFGGARTIYAPVSKLKIIQRKVNQVLQSIYEPHQATNGYVSGRNIVTNAKKHANSEWVLTIDLKDFFPTINLGRVMGLLKKPPYNCSNDVATTFGKICCFNNSLPQGAPTSPTMSNMICSRLDRQLAKLARKYDCKYTRYADDISLSTQFSGGFSQKIVRSNDEGVIEAGDELKEIINTNGFDINPGKIRLRSKYRRQVVTGLVINENPNVPREYVRKIRAMLHAWEKFGLEAAQTEFAHRHDKQHRNPFEALPNFKLVVKGRIEYLGMVKGKLNPVYLRFRHKLRTLAPELVSKEETPEEFLIRISGQDLVKELKNTVNPKEFDDATLSKLLIEVDPTLESQRIGAWQTFHGNSVDKLRQATHSMREVLRQLLDKLAPDGEVKATTWYANPPGGEHKVTRKQRVRYIVYGPNKVTSQTTVDYVDSVAKVTDTIYDKLSAEAHRSGVGEDIEVGSCLKGCENVMVLILCSRYSLKKP